MSSTVVLLVAIVLGGFIGQLGGSLFEYIQSLYAFFAPPFAALFLLGILWKRINTTGATMTVVLGFLFGVGVKLYIQLASSYPQELPEHPAWLEPYANQAAINWLLCVVICIVGSLFTRPPRPEQITDQVTLNWKRLAVLEKLGTRWYTSVLTWWALFVAAILTVMLVFSGLCFPVYLLQLFLQRFQFLPH